MKVGKFASIDIGSSSIRLLIVQCNGTEIEVLEDLRQAVKLGKDCFYKGKLSRQTINDAILIIKRYKKLCDEYKVTNIKAVATTAVREAANADIFIDNIKSYTGVSVEILSAFRETEYIHQAILRKYSDIINDETLKCIAEVGAGSVEITIFDKECIIYSTSLPIGALKAKQLFNKEFHFYDSSFYNYLNTIVEHELRLLKRSIPDKKIAKIFGIGVELEELGEVIEKNEHDIYAIQKERLQKLCEKMQNYSKEEIIHKFKVSYDVAENLYAIGIIFLSIIDYFDIDEVYIPTISLKECLIDDLVYGKTLYQRHKQLEKQIKINSINIARTFNYDEKHSLKVLDMALKIFEKTKDIHKLSDYDRLYLIASAILHDVGLAISNREHHKHSLYIIKSQNFYYFNDRDRNIIANVARYHRKSLPKTTHTDYMNLDRNDRILVSKLASILRVADSLDSHHLQIVEDFDIEIDEKEKKIIFWVKSNSSIYAEYYSFNFKKDLFEEYFGYTLILKEKNRER